MDVAFVVSMFPCLSESFVVEQVTGLLDLGHNVNIVAFSKSDQTILQKEIKEYRLLEKVTYIIMPKRKWALRLKGLLSLCSCFIVSPGKTVRLLKLFKDEGTFSYQSLFLVSFFLHNEFDIVHGHFGPNGIRSLCLKKIGIKAKLLTTFHGYDVTVYVRQHGESVYQSLFNLGDLFTYNSEATKQKLLGLGCPEYKMKKLPMAIDLKQIPFKERELKVGETIRLLSVGRLVEMKGREYAIRAIASLKDKYPIQYDIVGDGPLRAELEDLIKTLDLKDTVHLWGWISSEQRDKLYEQAHLFVHPSVVSSNGNEEGQGVVLLEAQAYGIPVVATNHGAFPDSLIDGVTGFLVPEKDAQELASKIDGLIHKSDSWSTIGKKGREFVENNFDAKVLIRKLEMIYND